MKRRILAALLVLMMLTVPALGADTPARVLTKDGPLWMAVRGEELVYSKDKGKTWSLTDGYGGGVGNIQDIQYTGKGYFLTGFWCQFAYVSDDGKSWSHMPQREWFRENAGYITSGLASGKYELLWTGREYMMQQSIQGDPRPTHISVGPNPRNKMVTFLDENFSILGALDFQGDVEAIRYQDGICSITVSGIEMAFTRADWEWGPRYFVTLDGRTLDFDDPPYNIDGRILVPLRNLAEALGLAAEYSETGVTCSKGDTSIYLPFESPHATVNGEAVLLDVPAERSRSRTYVPLRFVSEHLGLAVDWEGDSRTAVLRMKH